MEKTNQNALETISYLEQKSDSFTEEDVTFSEKFNMQNLQSIFCIYFIWISIAVSSLIMEISVYKFLSNKQQPKSI